MIVLKCVTNEVFHVFWIVHTVHSNVQNMAMILNDLTHPLPLQCKTWEHWISAKSLWNVWQGNDLNPGQISEMNKKQGGNIWYDCNFSLRLEANTIAIEMSKINVYFWYDVYLF